MTVSSIHHVEKPNVKHLLFAELRRMVDQEVDDDIAHAGLEEDRHGVSSINSLESSPLCKATIRNKYESNRGLLMAKVASSEVLEGCLSSPAPATVAKLNLERISMRVALAARATAMWLVAQSLGASHDTPLLLQRSCCSCSRNKGILTTGVFQALAFIVAHYPIAPDHLPRHRNSGLDTDITVLSEDAPGA